MLDLPGAYSLNAAADEAVTRDVVRGRRAGVAILVATATIGPSVVGGGARAEAANSCQLNSAKGNIKHVIYLVFDNTHFLRDNPNVPSDLEQMPHLLNFIRSNGTLLTNDHTVLISHTANGILTSLTGHVFGSPRPGGLELVPLLQGRRLHRVVVLVQVLDGSRRRRRHAAADPLPTWSTPTAARRRTLRRRGCRTPAPAATSAPTALANIVLENTGTGPNGDMTKVFGDRLAGVERGPGGERRTGRHARQRLAPRPTSSGWPSTARSGGGICAGNANARPDLAAR